MTDQMPATGKGDLRFFGLGFLDPIFTNGVEAALQGRFHVIRGAGLGDGDDGDLPRIAAGPFSRPRDPFLESFPSMVEPLHVEIQKIYRLSNIKIGLHKHNYPLEENSRSRRRFRVCGRDGGGGRGEKVLDDSGQGGEDKEVNQDVGQGDLMQQAGGVVAQQRE